MRAIVTGSAGFIGGHLVERLRAAGWDVTGIDRQTGPAIEDEPELPPRTDVIYHLASPIGPVGVLDQAGTIARQIVETSAIVAQWARWYDCPLIDVSTSEVYGSGHADAEDDVCTFRPASSARKEYAVAKLAAETMLRNTPGLDVRIVRPFNVAGPGQLAAGGFVIPRFVDQALAGRPLTVYRPGTQLRAFTHVADVVTGLILAHRRALPDSVYNLGNPDNRCSIEHLAREIIEATGSVSDIELVDPQELWGPGFREAPDKIPKAAKARRELGWIPTRSRFDIITDVLAATLIPMS